MLVVWENPLLFHFYLTAYTPGIASDISYTVVQPPSGKTRCEGLKGTCSSSCAGIVSRFSCCLFVIF